MLIAFAFGGVNFTGVLVDISDEMPFWSSHERLGSVRTRGVMVTV